MGNRDQVKHKTQKQPTSKHWFNKDNALVRELIEVRREREAQEKAERS